ncbi:MAG: DNA replication/repair protein RecF [Ruminococcaceae bacterium]|nr:DNA replication/repair protein RecF [Oscillospiraceae bacterium]
MIVLNLECKNFRNLENIKISPCEKMNVIWGENAQGKTNLIEAIWLFTGAKSFRNSKENVFLKFGAEKAVCSLDFKSEGIENNAKIEITDKKTAYFNDNKLKSSSNLVGKFNAVIFSPLDLNLISGGPSERRKFLDLSIGQIYPVFINVLKSYLRAVTQRNKIIKDYRYDSTLSVMLDVFEEEIATNGRKIIEFRKRYIDILNEYLPNIYKGISAGKEILETSYITKSKDNLLEELKLARKEDMYSGVTSTGPHRDDIEFKINGLSVRNFGSQGQKRSVALALKLAEAEVIKKKTGEFPVILLDDVMSELDKTRQNFILNHIEGMQSFLTCCDKSNFENLSGGKVFNIRNGGVE